MFTFKINLEKNLEIIMQSFDTSWKGKANTMICAWFFLLIKFWLIQCYIEKTGLVTRYDIIVTCKNYNCYIIIDIHKLVPNVSIWMIFEWCNSRNWLIHKILIEWIIFIKFYCSNCSILLWQFCPAFQAFLYMMVCGNNHEHWTVIVKGDVKCWTGWSFDPYYLG